MKTYKNDSSGVSDPMHVLEFINDAYLTPLKLSFGDLIAACSRRSSDIQEYVHDYFQGNDPKLTVENAYIFSMVFQTSPTFFVNMEIMYRTHSAFKGSVQVLWNPDRQVDIT